MKVFLAFACLLAGCLAQRPQPCKSPPLLTGGLSIVSQNEELFAVARYLYDAIGERIRLFEVVSLDNQTSFYDILLLYREHVMYQIDDKDRTCQKLPLKDDFMPLAIPGDATFVHQVVLGDSSRPAEGLLMNTWTGKLPDQGGTFLASVTDFGCIPISFEYQVKPYGWLQTTYFNNVIGITDPELLIPPSFCEDAEMPADAEPVDLLSLLKQKN
ncbi:ependymin-like [Cheilinus undulatus]|uniref:ependymin-like n=1 Tax=Cheilinus undulatus TaxID=241271 RepID=UPI001BD276C4|nr:ependymin-like [Cheilinus undulatus]